MSTYIVLARDDNGQNDHRLYDGPYALERARFTAVGWMDKWDRLVVCEVREVQGWTEEERTWHR